MKLFRISGSLWFKGFGTYDYWFLVCALDEETAVSLAFAKGTDVRAGSKPTKFEKLSVEEIALDEALVIEMGSR